MRNRTSDAIVSSILDDLDASRTESLEGINTLPEPESYAGCVCTMREERPPVQEEESFLSMLISGLMFR